ncbi:MAG TPA: hypothetical protein GX717_05885 [Clostridiaceae bacterium]|nr:hypothetical protein [Clostridiaceae bacterium]
MIHSFIVVGCETASSDSLHNEDYDDLIEVITNYMNEDDELDVFYIKTSGELPADERDDFFVALGFSENVKRFEARPRRENLFIFPYDEPEELTGDELLEAIVNAEAEKFADQIRQHVKVCGLADYAVMDRVVRALLENEHQVEVLKDAIAYVSKNAHKEAIGSFLEMGANVD